MLDSTSPPLYIFVVSEQVLSPPNPARVVCVSSLFRRLVVFLLLLLLGLTLYEANCVPLPQVEDETIVIRASLLKAEVCCPICLGYMKKTR